MPSLQVEIVSFQMVIILRKLTTSQGFYRETNWLPLFMDILYFQLPNGPLWQPTLNFSNISGVCISFHLRIKR